MSYRYSNGLSFSSPSPAGSWARYIWTLNPASGEVKLLLDTSKYKDPLMLATVVNTKDGRSLLLRLIGQPGYELDVDNVKGFGKIEDEDLSAGLVHRQDGQLDVVNIYSGPFYQKLSILSGDNLKPLYQPFTTGNTTYSVFPPGSGRELFGRVWYRDGDTVPVAGAWPAVDGDRTLGRGAYIWLAFADSRTTDSSRWLVAYRPAPPGSKDPAAEDQWVGPFREPGTGYISRLAPSGDDSMWLTNASGVFLVNCQQAIAAAVARGMSCSTHQWQMQYAKRMVSADWKSALIPLLAARQWKSAGDLLDAAAHDPAVNGDAREMSVLELWRAYLAAARGDFRLAASKYESVATVADKRRDYPEEIFARMNQIAMLYDAKRWADLIDLAARVNARFPQTTPQPGADLLARYLATAKSKIAATQPAHAEAGN